MDRIPSVVGTMLRAFVLGQMLAAAWLLWLDPGPGFQASRAQLLPRPAWNGGAALPPWAGS